MNSTDEIRAAVTKMERAVSLLGPAPPADEARNLESLRASWRALVDALALGPAPRYWKCPHCGNTGMRAATRCGTCWMKLVPPPADGGECAEA